MRNETILYIFLLTQWRQRHNNFQRFTISCKNNNFNSTFSHFFQYLVNPFFYLFKRTQLLNKFAYFLGEFGISQGFWFQMFGLCFIFLFVLLFLSCFENVYEFVLNLFELIRRLLLCHLLQFIIFAIPMEQYCHIILRSKFTSAIYKQKQLQMLKIPYVITMVILCEVICINNLKSDTSTFSSSNQHNNIYVKFANQNNQQIDIKSTFIPTQMDDQSIPLAPVINLTPLLLQQFQAPRSSSYRNKITEDQIKANSIFNRQINANKAIANLLELVERLTANVNYARNQIPKYQNQFKKSVSLQRTAQAKVQNAENQKSRFIAAINNLNDSINMLKKQLSQLQLSNQQRKQGVFFRKNKILTLNQEIQENQNIRKDLVTQFDNKKQERSRIQKQYAAADQQVRKSLIDIQKNKKQASSVDGQIEVMEKKLKNIDQEITDLKRRLNAAQSRKSYMVKYEANLRQMKQNAPYVQAKLEKQLLESTKRLQQINSMKAQSANQEAGLNKSLSETIDNINTKIIQINQIKGQIQGEVKNLDFNEATIKTKSKQVSDTIASLQYLKNQMSNFQTNLPNIYFESSDANARVQSAKENLQAVIKKWEKSSTQLTEVTSNLQKARAQKELADLAVQEILRERSNVLPYATLTNINLMQKNDQVRNSAKQPTGQISKQNQENSKPKKIFLLPLYKNLRSSEVSQGQKPETEVSFDENGNFMYRGDFKCQDIVSERFEGVIIVSGINIFMVECQDGRILNAKIGSCSQLKANSPNYLPKVGDRISISGKIEGNFLNIYESVFNFQAA